MLVPKTWKLGNMIGICISRAGNKCARFGVPDPDDERGPGLGGDGTGDLEPESITDGKRGGLAGVDQVPPRTEIFDSPEAGGGSEGEEIDSAKDAWREVEEKNRGRESWVCF